MIYKRVLLKLSGEALLGARQFGIDQQVVARLASDIKAVLDRGIELAVVIGGGNIFRGVKVAADGMDRASADYMGMLATVMNGLSLQAALEKLNVPACVLSAVTMPTICEAYIRNRALGHLHKGRVVILVGGTGNPFFTTDTAAALRAAELDCQVLLKGTQVDGVYSADPKLDANAHRYDRLTFTDVLKSDLRVMDMAAIALCRENNVPIMVFSIHQPGNLDRVLMGDGVFTHIMS